MERGLDGDIYMGAGDDTLDLNISALAQEASEALLVGGQGHDVLNLLHGGFDDFAIEQQPYEGYYTITADGQTFSVNGFEEINTIDGSLFDLLV